MKNPARLPFVIREVVEHRDKERVFRIAESLGAVITHSRRDFDGGEIIVLTIKSRNALTLIQWWGWRPWELPEIFIGSNRLKTLSAVLAALAFDEEYFQSITSAHHDNDDLI